jgi:hypothetical protein
MGHAEDGLSLVISTKTLLIVVLESFLVLRAKFTV